MFSLTDPESPSVGLSRSTSDNELLSRHYATKYPEGGTAIVKNTSKAEALEMMLFAYCQAHARH